MRTLGGGVVIYSSLHRNRTVRHYPAHKNGQLNISELARVCDISRTTAYKYKALLEA